MNPGGGDEYRIQRKEFDAWEWEKSNEYPFAHYTDAVENIKQLKREGRHTEVEELLLWCIEYVEAEAEINPIPTIAPWYYEHLGIVYRKDGRHEDEVEVLERYIAAAETTGRAPRDKILERLAKAQALVGRS